MKWIARLLGAIGLKRKREPEAPENHDDTLRLDTSQLKSEKSLGAELHEWLDETQRMTEKEREADEDDDHTRTVPTLKESDLPDLDLPDDKE